MAKTMNTSKVIGKTATIGRFLVQVTENLTTGEPLVAFKTSEGRTFGSIRLATAMKAVVVDLYESAEWRLGLPLVFDIRDYCLTDTEVAELRGWANGIAAA